MCTSTPYLNPTHQQDITTLAADMQLVKPTILFAVPTLYKKVYDRIQEKINAQGYLSRMMVDAAVAVAETRLDALRAGTRPSLLLEAQYRMWDRLVLSKLREPLGGMVRISPVGGSKMSVPVTRFFEAALGIAILEGYGLSETSPLLAIGRVEVGAEGVVGDGLFTHNDRLTPCHIHRLSKPSSRTAGWAPWAKLSRAPS